MLKFKTMALINPVMDIITTKLKKKLQSFKSDAYQFLRLCHWIPKQFLKLPMYRDPIFKRFSFYNTLISTRIPVLNNTDCFNIGFFY